jgi:hypothetical protein
VVYRENRYDEVLPGYRAAEDRHSLDFGIELHLKSGRCVSFVWAWPVCYYLRVRQGDLSPELVGDHLIWDVSEEMPWPTLVGRPFVQAVLSWFQSDEMEGDFPLTAKLLIEGGAAVYITLGIANGDDHLEVLLSDDAARAFGRFI